MVLPGVDTSGKDGTIKHVMAQMNPQGVRVVAFREPTPEEVRRGFLWRIRRALPGPGEIVIFNRSHYEDVLVPRVKKALEEGVLERRYGQINRFEKELAEKRATTVVKVCLHISYEEQRQRLLARLQDPSKRWKFSEHDLVERAAQVRVAEWTVLIVLQPVLVIEMQRPKFIESHREIDFVGGIEPGQDRVRGAVGAVVRGARQPQVVPQLGGCADPHRDAGGDEPRLSAAQAGRRGPGGAAAR